MIPYGRQSIDADDISAVIEVLKGDTLTGGPYVAQFEGALARSVSAPYTIACANGTAALHLAMLALGVGPGDAVVVPTLTFLATANAARYVGADVRFADVDPDTGLLTAQNLEKALVADGPGIPKAVISVHLNGQSADMQSIADVAGRHGLAVVEDACHAIGGAQVINGERLPVGSAMRADIVCFSFHPVKTIAMGEGGALSTRKPELAERLRRLRNHGMQRDPSHFTQRDEAFSEEGKLKPWYYEMSEPGFNYRISDILCALGASQLAKLPTFVDKRRILAAEYDRLVAALAPAVRPVPRKAPEDDGWHLYPVLIDFKKLGIDRGTVMGRLAESGIGSQVHYLPVHRQPYYRGLYPNRVLPGADAYYERCLTLPLFATLTVDDIRKVVAALEQAVTKPT